MPCITRTRDLVYSLAMWTSDAPVSRSPIGGRLSRVDLLVEISARVFSTSPPRYWVTVNDGSATPLHCG